MKSCTHPLCGRVLDLRSTTQPAADSAAASCANATWPALLDRLRSTLDGGGIAALGEVHDNLVHHTLRAGLLNQAKAVVFEQMRGDQQSALDASASKTSGTIAERATELMRRVNWKASGWPEDDYRPLIESALAANSRIYAGDAARDAMKALSMGKSGAIAEAERVRLKLDEPLSAALAEASLDEIEASHCGMMPKSAFGGMADAQRYRDAHLADVALAAATARGNAVLIAGNGHVRSDRGVPWYLTRRDPGRPVLSVLLIEVEDGNTDPLIYVPRDPDGKPAADFAIFTPATQRGDPCEKFRAKKAG